ncbi:MAG: hypothetical protein RID53_14805 [Coleofasciculus sp. B1-GNL1-01]
MTKKYLQEDRFFFRSCSLIICTLCLTQTRSRRLPRPIGVY